MPPERDQKAIHYSIDYYRMAIEYIQEFGYVRFLKNQNRQTRDADSV